MIFLGSLVLVVGASRGWAQAPTSSNLMSMISTYRPSPAFVENRGQWDGDFRYEARYGAMTVFVEETGWTFTLVESGPRGDTLNRTAESADHETGGEPTRGVGIGMHFSGGARAESIVPGRPAAGLHHYFLGNDPTRWRSDIPRLESLRLARPWPGIDVVTRTENGHFEYDIIADPGCEISKVTFDLEGAERLRIDADGALIIETLLGEVRQPPAKTWQESVDGRREELKCDYVILGLDRFGFAVPDWQGDRRLVIDPGLILPPLIAGSPVSNGHEST